MTRQARWLIYPDLTWLEDGEVQADALLDLKSVGNKLSVYKVDHEEDAERIVVALAANRDNLAVMDYALFEEVSLITANISIVKQAGETPDDEVNTLHYNLSDLTVHRLAKLAEVVSAGQHTRIPRKEMRTKLCRALDAGVLNRGKVKHWLLEMCE